MWWAVGGKGYTRWATTQNEVKRVQAHGDGAFLFPRSLRGVHGRVSLPRHVRGQPVQVDAALRYKAEV